MENIFQKALNFVLAQEGGFSNDPDDNGGATNLGITQRVFNGYLAHKGLKPLSVKNINRLQAEEIYRVNYWLKTGCHKMSPIFAILCFDTAVNMGVSRALEFLSAAKWSSVEVFLLARIEKYVSLAKTPSQRKFLLGWLNRVFRLYSYLKKIEV